MNNTYVIKLKPDDDKQESFSIDGMLGFGTELIRTALSAKEENLSQLFFLKYIQLMLV